MGTAINHPVPDRVKPSFVIFDIRALWRSALSVRVPGWVCFWYVTCPCSFWTKRHVNLFVNNNNNNNNKIFRRNCGLTADQQIERPHTSQRCVMTEPVIGSARRCFTRPPGPASSHTPDRVAPLYRNVSIRVLTLSLSQQLALCSSVSK